MLNNQSSGWVMADEIARFKRTGSFLLSPEEEMSERLDRLLLTVDELCDLPPVQWLVDGVIQKGESNLMVGQPASGKSLFALDMSLALASGATRWLGLPTEPCVVLYVTLENETGMGARVRAWRAENPDADLSNFHIMHRDGADTLNRSEIDTYIGADNRIKPGLIVIDTLARFDPEAESSASDAGKAIAALDRLRRNNDTTILLVHHLGKDSSRGSRGSNALTAAPTQTLVIKKEDADSLSLSVTESNNAAEADGRLFVRIRSGLGGAPLIDPGELNATGLDGLKAAVDSESLLRITRVRTLLTTVLDLTADTPVNTTAIHRASAGGRDDVTRWLGWLVERGFLHREDGERRSKLYSPGERSAEELTLDGDGLGGLLA